METFTIVPKFLVGSRVKNQFGNLKGTVIAVRIENDDYWHETSDTWRFCYDIEWDEIDPNTGQKWVVKSVFLPSITTAF